MPYVVLPSILGFYYESSVLSAGEKVVQDGVLADGNGRRLQPRFCKNLSCSHHPQIALTRPFPRLPAPPQKIQEQSQLFKLDEEALDFLSQYQDKSISTSQFCELC